MGKKKNKEEKTIKEYSEDAEMDKKVGIIDDKKEKTNNERLMTPTEFAQEEKLDQYLFWHWKDKKMTYKEYEKIKKEIIRGD